MARKAKPSPRERKPQVPFLRKSGTATQLIVGGEPFVMLSGEIHNSSSSSLDYMDAVWDKLAAMNCNSAVVPIYWELVEPEEGKFDFSLVDGVIQGARERSLRLVLLWFATWKNALSSYTPAWVKKDLERFPRAQTRPGENSGAITSLCDAACEADSKAFATVMRHVRQIDERQQTVLMIQIENETGLLGASRDHGPTAEAAFAQDVPAELMEYLEAHKVSLLPELREIWEAEGCRGSGTWPEVFGSGAGADEVFMAWHVARFVDRVTAAGKAEYPLPMYANAWLCRLDGKQEPGTYPSGGPVSRMMDVWRAAAPHVDLLAPDIYADDFRAYCASFARSGNPLFIPEAHRDERAAANVFYALAEHDAICFAPFGIDGMPDSSPYAEANQFLAEWMPLIVKHQGTGQMIGLVQQGEKEIRRVDLGGHRLRVQFREPMERGKVPGRGLIIAVEPDEYLVAGSGFSVDFLPKPGGLPNVDFLAVDEGRFERGRWLPGRRLNGDESGHGRGLHLHGGLRACRVRLYSYA